MDILEGRADRAISILQEGLTLTKDTTVRYSLFKNLGWASLARKQYLSAETYLKTAIALKTERSSAYCLLAQLEEARGRGKDALQNWEFCRKFASRAHADEKRWLPVAEERLLAAERPVGEPTEAIDKDRKGSIDEND